MDDVKRTGWTWGVAGAATGRRCMWRSAGAWAGRSWELPALGADVRLACAPL